MAISSLARLCEVMLWGDGFCLGLLPRSLQPVLTLRGLLELQWTVPKPLEVVVLVSQFTA